MTDPGLRFWLDHVEAEGGLCESSSDGVLVMLPSGLSEQYRLAEELVVTDDPDIARTDGVTFLAAGHPVLTEAARTVLDTGDAGYVQLQRPAGRVPDPEVLQDRIRAQFPVSHGRIDAAGPPRLVTHWVLQVGALVTYTLSADDQFQEQVQRWVHAGSWREVAPPVVEKLAHTAVGDSLPGDEIDSSDLVRGLAEADRLIAADALRRRAELSVQLGPAHDAERQRAIAYYADVVAGIERRLLAATPDRRGLLETRLVDTRQEQDRRLAEIAEKYQARHEIRPYRLRVLAVPAYRLPVDIRRGDRRYPMELDWLTPAAAVAHPRCPSCASTAPLVAGKTALLCLVCAAPAAPAVASAPTAPGSVAPGSVAPGSVVPGSVAPVAPKPAVSPVSPKPQRPPPAAPAPPRRARPPVTPARPPRQPADREPAWRARVETMVSAVWQAAADGSTRGLRRVLAPDSPAAALHQLYGVDGLRLAIGVPRTEQLRESSARYVQTTPNSGTMIGHLVTNRHEYPYALQWRVEDRTPVTLELLPFPAAPNGRFPNYYWYVPHGPLWINTAPPHDRLIDEVAQHLLDDGVAWLGLAVAARALASWWRLGDRPPALAEAPPAVLAAAIQRLVAWKAGEKGLFRSAAEAYRTDEASVRRADAHLRRALSLGPDRAW
jgi:hypothetical protein